MARFHLPVPGPAVILFLTLLAMPLSGWSMAAPATEEENEPTSEATREEEGGRDIEYKHVAALFLGFTDEQGHDVEATEGREADSQGDEDEKFFVLKIAVAYEFELTSYFFLAPT